MIRTKKRVYARQRKTSFLTHFLLFSRAAAGRPFWPNFNPGLYKKNLGWDAAKLSTVSLSWPLKIYCEKIHLPASSWSSSLPINYSWENNIQIGVKIKMQCNLGENSNKNRLFACSGKWYVSFENVYTLWGPCNKYFFKACTNKLAMVGIMIKKH